MPTKIRFIDHRDEVSNGGVNWTLAFDAETEQDAVLLKVMANNGREIRMEPHHVAKDRLLFDAMKR